MKRTFLTIIALSGIIFACLASESDSSSPSSKLKTLEPNDIESIQIFRLESQKGETKRLFIRLPINKKEYIQGILSLCKKAQKYKQPEGVSLLPPNYIFVAKLKNGNSIEIPFSFTPDTPFGELDSNELREALYAFTYGCNGSIIHFNNGKVIDVLTFYSGMIFTGYQTLSHSMRLEKDGNIVLTLKLRKDGIIIMEDSQPIRYGQAQVFKSDVDGYMIVYIEQADDYDKL